MHTRWFAVDDADRTILVLEALMARLITDARVQQACGFATWQARAIEPVERLLQQRQTPPATWELSHTAAAGMFRDVAGDEDALRQLVLDDLALPYPWLAGVLLLAFQGHHYGRDLVFAEPDITVTVNPGESPADYVKRHAAAKAVYRPLNSRGAKGGGSHLARDVDWYYRARIKRPADPKPSLAVEHVAAQRAVGATLSTDAHSVVYASLDRVEKILAGVAPVWHLTAFPPRPHRSLISVYLVNR